MKIYPQDVLNLHATLRMLLILATNTLKTNHNLFYPLNVRAGKTII